MTSPADHLPTLRSGRWFAALPPGLAQALIDMAETRSLATGEALFLRGNAPCGLYAVVRGAIDISGVGGQSDKARASLLTRLEVPAWFGEIALFDGSVRTHDAHAATPGTLLLHVPQEPLLAHLARHPQHWHALALLLTDKLRTALVALEEMALLPAPQRVAWRLALMAEGYGQWTDGARSRRVIALSQEELSLMLALSRQTINQILQDLQARGLLQVHRGEIEVCDLPALRAAGG
ncbi:Crp/Fnr family transcriptional regulator [Acidovorax sp. NCPPB 3576]|uniref:Crp/Fnr family transcriptional regulator n=1 Tax=Acidovorax sp. NCPPB 3576 TaxID=2940488 RepID=UPI002349FDFC|nr:Crp/Fnr family transcriptional regulator [Acidovorax sp. NCPPB 3576]WCM86290.1 Crp/Fnr family transcriptional regulator [Acidovorax sp. NCPPB 3576]